MKSKGNCGVILIVSVFLIVCQIAGCGTEGSLYDMSTQGLTIATSSSSVEADGVSSVTITATVTDTSGSSVPTGTPVNFSTSMGHFANGEQHITLEILPDANTTQVSLISSTETGTAEVTVESLGVTQFTYITFGSPIVPGHPETITLAAASESITGAESTIITATLTPRADDYVTMVGTYVTFTTTLGVFTNGQRSETAVVTGTQGIAFVRLFVNGETGTAVIGATSEGIPSNTVSVTLTAETTETTETTTTTITTTTTTVPRDTTI